MPLLTASSLQKSFSTRLLFSEVSFEVGFSDRIGLVGVNGCGKTTLFRVLRGLETVDEGSIYKNRELNIGVVHQMADAEEGNSLSLYEYALRESACLIEMEAELERISHRLEVQPHENTEQLILREHNTRERFYDLGGLTYKSRTRSVLLGLGFSEAELEQPLLSMSGGQKSKAQLARLLLSDANMLLLDEPTNHLDIAAISWLEDFLGGFKKSFIVISHDRYFLDKVTNRTFEIKNNRLKITNAPYSEHIRQSESKKEEEARRYKNTQREIRRIQAIVEQQRRWGQERNFITAASKLKQVERLKATLVEPERDTDSICFRFKINESGGNDVLVAEGLSKGYGEKLLFSDVSLHITKGERVFLLGPNGCGKTTLLRMLSRSVRPDSGNFYYGSRVTYGYYDQNVNAKMGGGTLLEELHDMYPLMNQGELRSAMARFLFKNDDVYKKAALASGGERARVQLLALMLSGANMLLLDEPTNHLDIASREALESALEDYEGTMLVVTHDRYLVNKLADRILYMSDGRITEFAGGYDEFLEERSTQTARVVKEKSSEAKPNKYKEQKEFRSALNRASGEVARAEKRIAQAEEELNEIEAELKSEASSADYKKLMELSAAAGEKRKEVDALYNEWEELAHRLSELENV